jgi:capsular polysaccharide biosynthesis protein
MSEQSFNSIPEDEISLKDIIDFLVESWQTIILTGLLGLLGSIAYLWVTPDQYQATAQIKMAQISASNSNNNNTNPLGINIEEPKLLLARLKLPTTYSDTEFKACGLSDQKLAAEILTDLVKFSEVKGAGSIVELKVNGSTKEIASACAEALFKNIQASQNEIIKPYLEEAKTLLINYQERLNNAQALVVRADKTGTALSAAYLASRDEVKFLTEEIIRLSAFITSVDARQAKLASPIYAADVSVFPKKTISLILGLMAGLFLGLLLAFGKRGFIAYKASSSLQH